MALAMQLKFSSTQQTRPKYPILLKYPQQYTFVNIQVTTGGTNKNKIKRRTKQ